MKDTDRLAAHREIETEGSTTPAQARAFRVDDHARPWTMHTADDGTHFVRDNDGLLVANGLSKRDAILIAGAPAFAALAQDFCDDLDRALTRVGL